MHDVITCRGSDCRQKLRVPTDRGVLRVHCPTCGARWEWSPASATPPGQPRSATAAASEPTPARDAAAAPSGPTYKVVHLTQGSREWLRWRHDGIGGSEAPTVMGENRYESVKALLRKKVAAPGESFMNDAMRRGKELEPVALARYAAATGLRLAPVCLESAHVPWLRASLDGLATDGVAAVEIKCGKKAHEITATTGEVPRHYYGQLQHILAITGLPAIDFFCHWPGEQDILLRVPRNIEYIRRLVVKEREFWGLVVKLRSA